MILAQYTIRSKQDYIFKTNRVLEIIGASENIAQIWNQLFDTVDTISLKYRRTNGTFIMEGERDAFQNGTLNFIELFFATAETRRFSLTAI